MAKRTLIKGGTVVTVDPELGDIPERRRADRGRRDRRGRPEPRASSDAEVIDATDCLVLPGLGRHAPPHLAGAVPQHRLRLDARALLHRPARHAERALPPEDTYAGNLIGTLEALDSGITTLLDWSHNLNTPRAHRRCDRRRSSSRARASSSRTAAGIHHWQPVSSLPHPADDVRRMRERAPVVRRRAGHAVPRAARQPVRDDGGHQARLALAEELGLRITCHFGDGEWGKNRPVAALREQGLLGPTMTFVHCNTLADDELADDGRQRRQRLDLARHRAADGPRLAGDRAAARRRHPPEPLDRRLLLERRPPVRDDARDDRHRSAASTTSTRASAARRRSTTMELTCRDVLEFATIEGARACGLDGEDREPDAGQARRRDRRARRLVRDDAAEQPDRRVRLQRAPGSRRHDPRRRQGRQARRQAARRRRGARAAPRDRVARRHPPPRGRRRPARTSAATGSPRPTWPIIEAVDDQTTRPRRESSTPRALPPDADDPRLRGPRAERSSCAARSTGRRTSTPGRRPSRSASRARSRTATVSPAPTAGTGTRSRSASSPRRCSPSCSAARPA